MRSLGSAYYSESSLASPLLPSLSPVPHACVVHMSLGGCQGLADTACFTAKHTCFLQPAKLFSCWLLGWMLISLQTSCLHSFSFPGRKNPFSLSLTPFLPSPSNLSSSLLFSFHFFCKNYGKRKQVQGQARVSPSIFDNFFWLCVFIAACELSLVAVCGLIAVTSLAAEHRF